MSGPSSVSAEKAEAALAKVVESKRALDEMLRAFAPAKYGWILQQQIDVMYHNAVLACTQGHKELKDSPVVAESLAYRPYLYSTDAMIFYSGLVGYYDFGSSTVIQSTSTFAEELPEYEKRAIAAGPETVALLREFALLQENVKPKDKTSLERLKELQGQLHKAQVLGLRSDAAAYFNRLLVQQLPGKLPDATLNIALLVGLQTEGAEALAAYALIEPLFGQQWPRQYLDSARRKAQQEQASVNAVLSRASQTTSDALGDAVIKLETGARLYQKPDLSGEALIAALRKTHPGKALLLDFWGPWCGACMDDLPSSKKLHDAVADAPIEFVYLCSQSSEIKWKDAVARLGLSGTHVLLTGKQNSELMALFKFSGYPSYAWIDRQGAFIPGTLKKRMRETSAEDLRELVQSTPPPTAKP